ncbi:hypothetical protein [Haloarchaeobius sp. HRN-SO-5]|uniref:hypothetical protein n=1 Tax=Haloarchaeobius sp. HRN-SO-5 TaxID=3446118 RepID=UPI003EB85A84
MNVRQVAYLALLAIPAILAYSTSRTLYPALAVVNVLLITWGLLRMFGPSETDPDEVAH